MKWIPIFHKPPNREPNVVAYAVVDDADAERVAEHAWFLGDGYARRRTIVDGRRVRVSMHEQIIGKAPRGMVTSHENGVKLDNRRANLRHTTQARNSANPLDGAKRTKRTSAFRGVVRNRQCEARGNRCWYGVVEFGRAESGHIKGRHRTAFFWTPEEAHKATCELRLALGITNAIDAPERVAEVPPSPSDVCGPRWFNAA